MIRNTDETYTCTLEELQELLILGWNSSSEGCNAEYANYTEEEIHKFLCKDLAEHLQAKLK